MGPRAFLIWLLVTIAIVILATFVAPTSTVSTLVLSGVMISALEKSILFIPAIEFLSSGSRVAVHNYPMTVYCFSVPSERSKT